MPPTSTAQVVSMRTISTTHWWLRLTSLTHITSGTSLIGLGHVIPVGRWPDPCSSSDPLVPTCRPPLWSLSTKFPYWSRGSSGQPTFLRNARTPPGQFFSTVIGSMFCNISRRFWLITLRIMSVGFALCSTVFSLQPITQILFSSGSFMPRNLKRRFALKGQRQGNINFFM